MTFDELLTDHVDYLHHEAVFLVDQETHVTTFRTLWFGLQHDSQVATTSPTVGHGALLGVGRSEITSVGDDYTKGEFIGMKHVIGHLLDRGVFDHQTATRYLVEQLIAVTPPVEELLVTLDGARVSPEDYSA